MDTPGPTRPLLPGFWSVYAVGEDEVELRSIGRSVRLSGARVAALLPSLLPVLDGDHTVSEICARVAEHPPEVVECLITQMSAHGLLVADGCADSVSGGLASKTGETGETGEYLRALVGPDGLPVARRRLAQATVYLWGMDSVSTRFREALRSCGVAASALAGRADELYGDPCADRFGRATLVVGCGTHLRDEALARINALSLATGTPWLPVVCEAAEVVLGPLVVPGRSACLVCVRVRAEALAAGPVRQLRAGSHPLLPAAAQVAAGSLAAEVLRILLGTDRPMLDGRLVRIHLRTLSWTQADVLRLPRCGACASVRPGRKVGEPACTARS